MAQMFSCEFCEISKNIFSHRIPPLGASRSTLIYSTNLYNTMDYDYQI